MDHRVYMLVNQMDISGEYTDTEMWTADLRWRIQATSVALLARLFLVRFSLHLSEVQFYRNYVTETI